MSNATPTHRIVLTCLSLAILSLGNAISHAQDRTESFVLIHSSSEFESVLRGFVTERVGGIEIQDSEGSRYFLARGKALFVGKNLEEVYQFKKQRVSQWSAGDHRNMSRWCIKNDLLDHAAEHYQEVAKQHRGHKVVTQLANELKGKMLADASFRKYLGLPILPDPTQKIAATGPEPAAVVLASHSGLNPLSVPARQAFATHIQPILQNRCSQAACHGAQTKSALRLYKPFGSAAARLTAKNLKQLRPFLEANGPGGQTPFLSFATNAHGKQKTAAINPQAAALDPAHAVMLQNLAAWVQMVQSPVVSAAAIAPPTAGAAVTTAGATGLHQTQAHPTQTSLTPVAPGQTALRGVPTSRPAPAGKAPQPTAPTAGPDTMREIDQLEIELNRILGEQNGQASTTSGNAQDPFDVSSFNLQAKKNRNP